MRVVPPRDRTGRFHAFKLRLPEGCEYELQMLVRTRPALLPASGGWQVPLTPCYLAPPATCQSRGSAQLTPQTFPQLMLLLPN